MNTTATGHDDFYRSSMLTSLAALPPPRGPRLMFWIGSELVDLGAKRVLLDRFDGVGAPAEDSWSRGARTTYRGVKLAATVASCYSRDFGRSETITRGILRASIDPSLGPLAMEPRPYALVRGWAARLGLLRECAVNEPATRDTFLIWGDQRTADVVLDSYIAAALRSMSSLQGVTIRRGMVDLAWSAPAFTDEAVLPAVALEIVVAVARASLERR